MLIGLWILEKIYSGCLQVVRKKVLLQNRIKQKNGSHMRRPFFFDKIKL